MRVYSVPAKYAPAITAALQQVVADIAWREDRAHRVPTADAEHEQLMAELTQALAPMEIDDRRVGHMVIVLGDLPGDDNVIALPLERHLKVAS